MLIDEGLELLDEAECRRLLASSRLGRVAVNMAALPAIFPVNFVVEDDHIVFRTGTGTKLEAATRHAVDRTNQIIGPEIDIAGIIDFGRTYSGNQQRRA